MTQQDGRPLLTIYLAGGQAGERAGADSRAAWTATARIDELPLPRLEVFDVDRQQGDVAVQVDPAFDVDAGSLTNCEPVLLGQLAGWLKPRAAAGDSAWACTIGKATTPATLRLRLRKPEVACDTITNVRLTDRAVEETILLDFTIQQRGHSRAVVPAARRDGRTAGSACRCCGRRRSSRSSKKPGSPLRVTIELQDEVMGQLRVLVENDRLLTPGSHDAPIPVVERRRRSGTIGDFAVAACGIVTS